MDKTTAIQVGSMVNGPSLKTFGRVVLLQAGRAFIQENPNCTWSARWVLVTKLEIA